MSYTLTLPTWQYSNSQKNGLSSSRFSTVTALIHDPPLVISSVSRLMCTILVSQMRFLCLFRAWRRQKSQSWTDPSHRIFRYLLSTILRGTAQRQSMRYVKVQGTTQRGEIAAFFFAYFLSNYALRYSMKLIFPVSIYMMAQSVYLLANSFLAISFSSASSYIIRSCRQPSQLLYFLDFLMIDSIWCSFCHCQEYNDSMLESLSYIMSSISRTLFLELRPGVSMTQRGVSWSLSSCLGSTLNRAHYWVTDQGPAQACILLLSCYVASILQTDDLPCPMQPMTMMVDLCYGSRSYSSYSQII